MIACDGACIPARGVHAPLLCREKLGGRSKCFKKKYYVCIECNIEVMGAARYGACESNGSVSDS